MSVPRSFSYLLNEIHFRQLNKHDLDHYLPLVLAAYASARELNIHFDAGYATAEQALLHLSQHGVYGMFDGEKLIASVTLRYPWGPLPGPFGLPHLGWFASDPCRRGERLGGRLLDWLEREILTGQLRVPAYSLGTALEHPWLRTFYQQLGFEPQHTANLGKGHTTLYMKKILDPALHDRWLTGSSL